MRRAVIQQLENWLRAGVPAIPRVAAAPRRSPSSAGVPPVQPVSASAKFQSEPQRPVASTLQGSQQIMAKKAGSPLSQLAGRCQTFEPLNLPGDERVARLEALRQRVAQCQRCQELATTRTQTVFGAGNPEAKLLFIGEAPGADEDQQGEPFVGRAGQLLNDIIKACRLKREEIYICNILRCRPPGNRLPAFTEAENCREYLDGQIAIVSPEYIVCWGACAARNLLGTEEAIGKLRGSFYTYGKAKVLCTYHPSYLLRNPSAKKDVWADMQYLFRDMGIDLKAK